MSVADPHTVELSAKLRENRERIDALVAQREPLKSSSPMPSDLVQLRDREKAIVEELGRLRGTQ